MKRHLLAAAVLLAAAGPSAGQPATGLDLSVPAVGPPVALPFRKPGGMPPQSARPQTENCIPGLPCGTQLYGSGRRRSAIELQVPALRW